jgi:hypothetical protein
MTTHRLWVAQASFVVLGLLAIPLDAPVSGSGFEVRHLVWILLVALAVKSWIAWKQQT